MNVDGFALVTGAGQYSPATQYRYASENELLYWPLAKTTIGSGIGKACSIAYAEEGVAGIVCADINLSAVEAVAEETKRVAAHPNYRALALQVDVTNEKAVDEMMQRMVKEFGRIDYALNCAGVSRFVTLDY